MCTLVEPGTLLIKFSKFLQILSELEQALQKLQNYTNTEFKATSVFFYLQQTKQNLDN